MTHIYRVAKVDKSKCVGCKRCERRCPTGAIKVKPAGDCKYVAPCQNTCPAGINVPGYVALAGKGDYEGAYRLIRRDNPFPSVCGRVCTHPCESACNRGGYDDSVAIRDVKRFVADKAYDGKFVKEPVWPKNGKRVAIIGAGPSGLTCGYYLALTGYEVDVFESESTAGGVLLFGIPEYRLPKEVLARDIKAIEEAGVKIHLNTKVGEDVKFEDLTRDYDAVYIATGTQFCKTAGVIGEDKAGVYHGLDFLKEISHGNAPKIGKNVVVVGGGNTAIDVSRTAVRMGAENVTIVYRRREGDMPAERREVIEALEEGVQLQTLVSPVEIVGDGKVEKIKCSRMKIGEPDERGRLSTHAIEGSEFELEADTVIMAVSQYADFPFIDKDEVELTEFGKLVLDEERMNTLPGVFAGGDVSRGSATAIEAIADGKQAAININNYLKAPTGINQGAEIELPPREEFGWSNALVSRMHNLPREERIKNNKEVALGLTEEQVKTESQRCYRCVGKATVDESICYDCGMCWEYCDQGAITMEPLPEGRTLQYPLPDTMERAEEILAICRKAHLLPMQIICKCGPTNTEEIVNAILDGARDMTDLTLKSGTRAGCTMYCVGQISRLFEACGRPLESREDDNYHPITQTLWDFSDEALDFDPIFKMREMQTTLYSDEVFNAAADAYRKVVKERSEKKNG